MMIVSRCGDWVLAAGALLLISAGMATGAEFLLADGGKPACKIVVQHPSPAAAFAAQELQRYIEAMAGAQLEIVPRDEATGPAIVLSQVDLGHEEAFRIAFEAPDSLTISGQRGRAIVYGVYELLERLGCRFLSLGDAGENVPRQDTLRLAFPEAIQQTPALDYRGLIVQQPINERTFLMIDWMGKNKMNYWVNPHGVFDGASDDIKQRFADELEKRDIIWEYGHHTFAHWITAGEREPELLGLRGGKRTSSAICISRPRAAEKVAQNMRAFIKRWPSVDIVSLWANDSWDGWCECDECKKLYGELPRYRETGRPVYSRPYFWFVSQVADKLAQGEPHRPICSLAYLNTIEVAPQIDLARDVLITVAPIGRNYAKPLAELEFFGPVLDDWAQRYGRKASSERGRATQVMAYEYYAGVYANISTLFPTVSELAADIGHYQATGFGGITTQAEEGHWGSYKLNFHALARMAWQGAQPPGRVIDDFCRDYYGPAAEPMTRYWKAQEEFMVGQESMGPAVHFLRRFGHDSQRMAQLRECLVEAFQEAADDPAVQTRLRDTQISLEYNTLLLNALLGGVGDRYSTLAPTPKGDGHLPGVQSGEFVHLRFALPKEGGQGFGVCLGNVVALSGAGSSYQLEVRRDRIDGELLHTGPVFGGTPQEAHEHIPARAWNPTNAKLIDLTGHLTGADFDRGHIDVFVTAHVEGDLWTVYRDNDGARDLYGCALPADYENARERARDELIAFVKEHAGSGVIAAPSHCLQRIRRLLGE